MCNFSHYYLRLSLTEACAFRCPYCLPEGPKLVTPPSQALSIVEIQRIVGLLAKQGVNRVRLTGGEPLHRKDVLDVVKTLKGIPGIREVALTTNGELLGPLAGPLKEAGLDRINIHLDSLKEDKFFQIARRSDLGTVLESIAAAIGAGLSPVKINAVIMRGVNDDELPAFCDFAVRWNVTVRFIELMNTGSAQDFFKRHFISAAEMRERIGERYTLEPRFDDRGAAPAEEYNLAELGATVGFIASESEPFCASCNRLRLTADGRLTRCLYEQSGIPLRAHLREYGTSDEELATILAEAIAGKRSHHPEFGKTGEIPFAMAQVGG